jgi:hypothetical protein
MFNTDHISIQSLHFQVLPLRIQTNWTRNYPSTAECTRLPTKSLSYIGFIPQLIGIECTVMFHTGQYGIPPALLHSLPTYITCDGKTAQESNEAHHSHDVSFLGSQLWECVLYSCHHGLQQGKLKQDTTYFIVSLLCKYICIK